MHSPRDQINLYQIATWTMQNGFAGSVMVSCRIVVPVTRVRFPASELFCFFLRVCPRNGTEDAGYTKDFIFGREEAPVIEGRTSGGSRFWGIR